MEEPLGEVQPSQKKLENLECELVLRVYAFGGRGCVCTTAHTWRSEEDLSYQLLPPTRLETESLYCLIL